MTTAPIDLPAAVHAALEHTGPVRTIRRLGVGDRTFLVEHSGADPTVVRLRPAPADPQFEARVTAAAHRAGVAPQVRATVAADGALLTAFVAGEVLSAGRLREPAVLAEVADALRRLHRVPATGLPDCEPIGHRAAYLGRARELGIEWEPAVRAAEDRSAAAVDRLLASRHQVAGHGETVLCHGDPVPGNLVRSSAGVVLLDFEFAGAGEAAFDLANFVVGAELDEAAATELVGAYCGGPDPAVLARVGDWVEVLRHAWYVWVVLGADLGPARAHWVGWAERVRQAWADESGAG